MAAQYFEDSDLAISEHLDGNLFVLTNNISNIFLYLLDKKNYRKVKKGLR
jgi:hypothetical protein